MNTLIAIRLDDTLDQELDRKATALGISKSKLVREALVDYLPRVKAAKPAAPKAEKKPAKQPAKAAKPAPKAAKPKPAKASPKQAAKKAAARGKK